MNFRTEIKTKKSNNIIYKDKIITLGSCFSENIGKNFKKYKFHTLINPFGILYNPTSIKQSLEKIMDKYIFNDNDLVFNQNFWHSLYHHGRFSNQDKNKVLEFINNSVLESYEMLEDCDYMLITFGSAYVYKYNTNNIIVANCHKIPEKNFSQYILDLSETFIEWTELITKLIKFNPKIKIIFTVSPIRYLKYGFEMNQLSKSILILLVNQLKGNFSNIDYFPAYEIFMDDLRDYRFYKDDLIHPSDMSIKYVWEKFSDIYFNQETISIIDKIKNIDLALNHRPINVNSENHQKFLKAQIENISKIFLKYPQLDFENEIKYFSNLLLVN